jgi:hypothetical protein
LHAVHGASGRLDHDGFASGKLFNGEHQVGAKFNVLRKSSINLYADAVQVFAFQEVSPFTVETFTASHRRACGSPLALLEPSDSGAKLNDLTRKFVTRREGKSWSEFTLVDVEICAADTASVNAEKNFVGLDFWNSNIPVFEFTRGVVNNGFHKEINERATFLVDGLGEDMR